MASCDPGGIFIAVHKLCCFVPSVHFRLLPTRTPQPPYPFYSVPIHTSPPQAAHWEGRWLGNKGKMSSQPPPPSTTILSLEEKRQRLSELFSEASALEKQLKDLQTQQNLILRNSKGSNRNAEQHAALDEEIAFLRDSLKDIYEEIILGDLPLATSSNTEERLWRNVFYAYIEDARARLRRLGPVSQGERQRDQHERLRIELNRHIDIGVGFYHDLVNVLKNQFGIDMNSVGIELFKFSVTATTHPSPSTSPQALKELAASTIQRCLIYLGDLARYRVVHVLDAESTRKSDDADAEPASLLQRDTSGKDGLGRWDVARGFYMKAAEVWRDQGKPYSQLALIAISTGLSIDVVYFYSLSLAMKHPSTVGRENLRSFYAKNKFPIGDGPDTIDDAFEDDVVDNLRTRKMLERFGHRFLQAHKELVFGDGRGEQKRRSSNGTAPAILTGLAELLLGTSASPEIENVIQLSIKDVLRATLTKAIVILMATVWELGERSREAKSPVATRNHLRTSQSQSISLAFDLLAPFDLSSHASSASLEHVILQPLSIWCTYLCFNFDLLAQIYALARRGEVSTEGRGGSTGGAGREREAESEAAREVLSRLMSFLRGLATRVNEDGGGGSSDGVADDRIATCPLPEDVELLGLMPLRRFHAGVVLLREAGAEAGGDEEAEGENENERRVRIARIRGCLRRFADVETFDFIQYNDVENKFIVIDEETKKQQRTRLMRALATQRLKEQVTSLEQDLSQLSFVSPPSSPSHRDRRFSSIASPSSPTTPSQKRQRRESKARHGNPAVPARFVTVVVDVSVLLDALALVKRWAGIGDVGVSGAGVVCEVVVPLDVIDSLDLHKKGTSTTNIHAREAIRFLDQWFRSRNDHHAKSAPAGLGHEGGSGATLLSLAAAGITSSFLRAQRVSERLEKWDDAASSWVGRAPEGDEDAAEGEGPEAAQIMATEMDVPKRYRPVIGCALYYYRRQRAAGVQQAQRSGETPAADVVLVTNDEEMMWWARMFGAGRGGLEVVGVEEWERELSGR